MHQMQPWGLELRIFNSHLSTKLQPFKMKNFYNFMSGMFNLVFFSLSSLQVSRNQYHCDGCGICRQVFELYLWTHFDAMYCRMCYNHVSPFFLIQNRGRRKLLSLRPMRYILYYSWYVLRNCFEHVLIIWARSTYCFMSHWLQDVAIAFRWRIRTGV